MEVRSTTGISIKIPSIQEGSNHRLTRANLGSNAPSQAVRRKAIRLELERAMDSALHQRSNKKELIRTSLTLAWLESVSRNRPIWLTGCIVRGKSDLECSSGASNCGFRALEESLKTSSLRQAREELQ